MALSTLPEELTDLIIQRISDRPTLHSLCLVSTSLSRIATPHLYTRIALQKDDFQHLRPLALLLWTSPQHRHAVRAFSVRRAYGGNLHPWPVWEGLEDLIKRMVDEFVGEAEKENWVRRVQDGVDALPIASLLLRSLPHVKEMQFDGFMLVDPRKADGKARSRWVV